MNLFEDDAVRTFITRAMSEGIEFSNILNTEDIKSILNRTVRELENHPSSPIFSQEGPKREKEGIYSILVEDVTMNTIMSIVYQPSSMHFNMLQDIKTLSPKEKNIIFHSVLNSIGVVMDSGLAGRVYPKNEKILNMPEEVQKSNEDCWVMP